MKRTLDFLLALIGITLSFPLWIFLGFLIWLEDRGPIFYGQDRLGKDGRIFRSLKFRSMHFAAEKGLGPVQAKEFDARITKTGRILRVTAIDELPQLWNILKGDMSFVGPRALMLIEADANETEAKGVWEFEGFKERQKVRPGLTGVAQVLAPRDIPRSQKFKYDIWYIENQSFWLDMRLIALSFLITFLGRWERREGKLSKRILKDLAERV
jgi:lipopolysaccharide/colanic/teichoic acid biosynthesis glycosyltransferase